jgi:MerR family transcriptional regulator, copper efflux regulator
MKIHELVERTGVQPRQIRYLISEGFIPPPRGGRATADYGEVHIAAIDRYQRLRGLGFLPSSIKLILGRGEPIPLAPGISVTIDPAALDPAIEPRRIADRLVQILAEAMETGNAQDADAPE